MENIQKLVLKTSGEFSEAFISHFLSCKAMYENYMATSFPNNPKKEFRFEVGSKNVKIINGGSVFSFVDIATGDVLKPASYRAPAKHARGNIFDDHNGMKYVGPYGPAYLR